MTHARLDDIVIKRSDNSCLVLFANLDKASCVLQVNSKPVGMSCLGEPPIVSLEPYSDVHVEVQLVRRSVAIWILIVESLAKSAYFAPY